MLFWFGVLLILCGLASMLFGLFLYAWGRRASSTIRKMTPSNPAVVPPASEEVPR
jgi:hypothetical protein